MTVGIWDCFKNIIGNGEIAHCFPNLYDADNKKLVILGKGLIEYP